MTMTVHLQLAQHPVYVLSDARTGHGAMCAAYGGTGIQPGLTKFTKHATMWQQDDVGSIHESHT